jgi:hypothetical protein
MNNKRKMKKKKVRRVISVMKDLDFCNLQTSNATWKIIGVQQILKGFLKKKILFNYCEKEKDLTKL